jgi:hypothetical protein
LASNFRLNFDRFRLALDRGKTRSLYVTLIRFRSPSQVGVKREFFSLLENAFSINDDWRWQLVHSGNHSFNYLAHECDVK